MLSDKLQSIHEEVSLPNKMAGKLTEMESRVDQMVHTGEFVDPNVSGNVDCLSRYDSNNIKKIFSLFHEQKEGLSKLIDVVKKDAYTVEVLDNVVRGVREKKDQL